MKGAQVNQNINQSILVSDGLSIAEFGAFDTEFLGLGIDAFSGGALFVDLFVRFTVAVKLVADASADTGGEGRNASAFGPLFVLNGAVLSGLLGEA